MIGEKLKRYSPDEQMWRQRTLAWQQRGFHIRQGGPARPHLFHFEADTGWQGFIDLEEWVAREMPQVAALGSASRNPQWLEILFCESRVPLSNLPQELAYTQLFGKGWVKGKELNTTWSYQTPQGRIWLSYLPDTLKTEPPAGELITDLIPVDIHFHIGSSTASCGLLKTIRQGDIALIVELRNRVASGGNILGDFIRTEEGLMLDDEYEDKTESGDEQVFTDEEIITEQRALVPRKKIKVRLDFILQTSRLTIAELESFYKGMILPCDPEAEKKITIMANGKNIARGELVWLEDKVGVEITDIITEDGDNAGE